MGIPFPPGYPKFPWSPVGVKMLESAPGESMLSRLKTILKAKMQSARPPRLDLKTLANHGGALGFAGGAIPGAAIGATNDDHPYAGALMGAAIGGANGAVLGLQAKDVVRDAGRQVQNFTRQGVPISLKAVKPHLNQAQLLLAGAPAIGVLGGFSGRAIKTPEEQLRDRLKSKVGL